MPSNRYILLIIATLIVLIAAAYRFPQLNARPFHGDEAVNAVKFKDLWETGEYRYDPHEYHGPTLPYLTFKAIVFGPDHYEQTTESTYRIVTAAMGILLVLITIYFAGAIGWGAAILAGLFAAVSLSMTYYSRYYIHEVPLVLFTFGTILCGWQYLATRKIIWAILCGASIGLTHATKETCIIAWFAMGVAMGDKWIISRRKRIANAAITLPDEDARITPSETRGLGIPAFVTFLTAAIVSMLFFSSFFTHWEGVIDSIRTYAIYFSRGTGDGDGSGGEALHIQPWYWYLKLLVWHRPIVGGPWYSEGPIVLLGVMGMIFAATGRGMAPKHVGPARFIASYTLTLIVVYSGIAYKTPWSMLGFLHGLILLAGIGAMGLLRITPTCAGKGVIALLLVAALGQLGYQNYRGNFVLHTHRSNPHLYGHPNANVRDISDRVEAIQASLDRPASLLVLTEENLWPLPFYFRHLEKVGYPTTLPALLALGTPDMILTSDERAPDIMETLGDSYEGPHFYGLRREVLVCLFVRRDVWDRYMKGTK